MEASHVEQLDVTAARISHSHPTEPTQAAGFEGLGLENATKVPRAASPAAEMHFARSSLLPSPAAMSLVFQSFQL